jgi:crossover junction endodeoxyribonuclease RusA
MIEVTLPFPPTALSPNSRMHWSALAKIKKAYREACWACTLEQNKIPAPDGGLVLELLFVKPSRRAMDRDNLLARMKSGLDGVADALKINDNRFTTVVVRVAPDDQIGGFVRLKIGEDNGEKTI